MKRFALASIGVLLFVAPAAFGKPCQSKFSDTSSLLRQAPGLKAEVLRLALDATACAAERGLVKRQDLITVIDYSLPSTQPRLFTFDLASKKLLFRELVAHGKNSGDAHTTNFSNVSGSLATSIGLFVTADPYFGSNGYSLRLKGLEEGFNDMAWDRAIVMHGASYVSRAAIRALGRLGRSWGCPAVRKEVAKKMIDTVRGGSAVFAYYPDKEYLKKSKFVASR
ncbi:MAG TPA: murein L,D-transpeptidase catalytic domain family protein [Thermoanaerobaculia bacterium]